jgi:hypothetical protein
MQRKMLLIKNKITSALIVSFTSLMYINTFIETTMVQRRLQMKNAEDTAGEVHRTLEIQNLEQAVKELRMQLSDKTSQIDCYEKVCGRQYAFSIISYNRSDRPVVILSGSHVFYQMIGLSAFILCGIICLIYLVLLLINCPLGPILCPGLKRNRREARRSI